MYRGSPSPRECSTCLSAKAVRLASSVTRYRTRTFVSRPLMFPTSREHGLIHLLHGDWGLSCTRMMPLRSRTSPLRARIITVLAGRFELDSMTSLKPQTIANLLRDGDLSFAGYGAHGYVVHALYIVSDSLPDCKGAATQPTFQRFSSRT